MQIADRCVVSFHYVLTNAAGETLDSSGDNAPLTYLHGAGNIVPGLEQALAGKQAGDKFDVEVAPEQGYGARNEDLLEVVPRAAFHGVDELAPGMQFSAEGPQGSMSVVIAAIDGDKVTVDSNHPLAGETLHFAVEVTDVREATDEEVQHRHVHGAGGHHH